MIALELPPLRHAMAMQAGLAFIAGFLEACGLIALFGLFIGHVTANIALLGMAIATDVPGSGTKLLALPVFMAVVALTRVGMHPLRSYGYEAARLIMALELSAVTGLHGRRPALWSIHRKGPWLVGHADGGAGHGDLGCAKFRHAADLVNATRRRP